MSKNTDHITLPAGDNGMQCEHCGAVSRYAVPMAVPELVKRIDAFVKKHRGCKAGIRKETGAPHAQAIVAIASARAQLQADRVATMVAMGAKRWLTTAEEAAAMDGVLPGEEWIGTDGHAWRLDTLADMDTRHWKQTLRDLKWSVHFANKKKNER